jgi:spore germination protein YaaH
MRMTKTTLATLAWLALFTSSAHAGGEANRPQVISWVPPYALEASAFGINANPKIGKALTHLGLQLWNPSADGRGLVMAPVDKTGTQVEPDSVIRFRDWAQSRGIKVLLTVYNNSQVLGKWDWPLAAHAFKDQRDAFIDALIAEMDKYKLDGIDIDLEGDSDHEEDRTVYADFIKKLADAVHAKGKLLTVDTFHSPCANAPNMSWWSDWVGKADSIHSMGYQDLYEESEDTFTPAGKPVCANGAHLFKYSWQLQYGMKAGYRVDQIVLGMPTWMDKWGKPNTPKDTVAHIKEAQKLGAGIALWDAQFGPPGWRSDATWDAVMALRQHPGNDWKKLK